MKDADSNGDTDDRGYDCDANFVLTDALIYFFKDIIEGLGV